MSKDDIIDLTQPPKDQDDFLEKDFDFGFGNWLDFECPDCNGTELELVCDNASFAQTVTMYKDGGYDFDETFPEIHDFEPIRWQCRMCGYTIEHDDGTPITEHEDVTRWLERDDTTAIIDMTGIVDTNEEIEALKKEIEALKAEMDEGE